MNENIFIKKYKYKPLKTKRLTLIKPDLKYIDELYKIYKDKHIWKYNGSTNNTYSKKQIEKNILQKQENWKKNKQISFFIIYENQLIGTIGTYETIKDFKSCKFGIIVSSKFWNKGFGSEILDEFTKFIFKNTIIQRISSEVCSENKPSIKILKRNKFKKEGTLQKYFIFNNKTYDAFVYTKLKLY